MVSSHGSNGTPNGHSHSSAAVAHAMAGVPNDEKFDWKPQPAAAALVGRLLEAFLRRCAPARVLAERMHAESANRMVDWLDHIRLPYDEELRGELLETGFVHKPAGEAFGRFTHEGGIFPDVILDVSATEKCVKLAIKVDSVPHFLAVWGVGPERAIEGAPFSAFRTACAFSTPGAELWVVERHGYKGYAHDEMPVIHPARLAHQLDQFCRRRRDWPTDAQGFEHARSLIDAAIHDFGGDSHARDRAAALWFEAERRYWMRRNHAAQVQYARQNKLGLGWANHDHHTYRSSRESFTFLIATLERLGVKCRERYHAGAEAGWGAQVMESPTAGIICVCDVDLTPDEASVDFAHEPLPDRGPGASLGTIGLWCALHGEAFLQAGMHHLECMFDWHALKDQLERDAQIKTMAPFTTFTFLRQAFTEGERWSVNPARVQRLLASGRLTQDEARDFIACGALGSHLENLERNDGYKGFNKEGISDIITRTDARKHRLG